MCALFLFSNSSAQKNLPLPKFASTGLKILGEPWSWGRWDISECVALSMSLKLQFCYLNTTCTGSDTRHTLLWASLTRSQTIHKLRWSIPWLEYVGKTLQWGTCEKTKQCGFVASTYILTAVLKLCLFLLNVWTSCGLWMAIYQGLHSIKVLRHQHLHLSKEWDDFANV